MSEPLDRSASPGSTSPGSAAADPPTGFSPAARRVNLVVGVVGACLWVALLMLTDGIGFTRDESFYFHAAREYAGWFEELEQHIEQGTMAASFTRESIDAHWSYNPEHPVLMKTLFALSDRYVHERAGLLGPSLAMRLPAMVTAAWLLLVVWLFALDIFQRRLPAVAAVLSTALMPRLFFHMHLTCFDVPITAVWVTFIWVWWRSLRSVPWAWGAGVAWGVGLITKLNAFFLPFVVLAHWGLAGIRRVRLRDGRLELPPVPLALFTMALLGPLIFHLGWPRHWFDTFARIGWYLRFHLHHEHYFEQYFGRSLWEPPFPVEFPFVMTATTTPLVLLVGFALGAALMLRDSWWRWRATGSPWVDERATGLLIALNILIPFLIIARPSTPIFGGVKHWFPALPFMALVIGYGVMRLHDALVTRWPRQRAVIAGALLATLAVPSALATAAAHPMGNAYYNELVGGVTGAADLRAMRQYWGYTARYTLDYLNETMPPGTRVHFHDSTWGSYRMYVEEGMLREDIVPTWHLRDSTCIIFDEQKAFADVEYTVWTRYGSAAPVFVAHLNGVPMATVYCRGGAPPAWPEAAGGDGASPTLDE